jgi:Arm DNA-binding domain
MTSIHKLNPREVETIKRKGMYADGGGLYLQVSNGGQAKSWIFRYHVEGRGERKMGLGSLQTIGLAEARELARTCRQQRQNGIDPIEARKIQTLEQELAAAKQVTLRAIRIGCARSILRRRCDLIPTLGELPVSAINVDVVEESTQADLGSHPENGREGARTSGMHSQIGNGEGISHGR